VLPSGLDVGWDQTIIGLSCLATAARSGELWASDCEAGQTRADLIGALNAWELAYQAADLAEVQRSDDRVQAVLRCEIETVDLNTSASLHLAHGMSRWAVGDGAGATLAFRAAARLKPDLGLDPELVPQGHPMRGSYEAAAATPDAAPLPVWPPGHDALWVDGSPASAVPQGRASVVQIVSGDGAARWSAYLAGAELPAGAPLSTSAPGQGSVGTGDDARPKAGAILLGGSGVALLGAGALWAASYASESAFEDRSQRRTLDGLRALESANHAEIVGAAGLGALGAALLGVGLAVEIRW